MWCHIADLSAQQSGRRPKGASELVRLPAMRGSSDGKTRAFGWCVWELCVELAEGSLQCVAWLWHH